MIASLELSALDLKELKPVKTTWLFHNGQDHCRWVLRNGTAYYKIWNPTYVRRDNLLEAIAAGFYDASTTPALQSVIYHRGLCRGYVMARCRPVFRMALDGRFFALIKEQSRRSGFFNVQFSPCHVMRYRGGFNLIDLDGVFPLHRLTEIYKELAFFDYENYERFIVGEYQRVVQEEDNGGFTAAMKNRRYFRNMPSWLRIGQSYLQQLIPKWRGAKDPGLDRIAY